MARYKTEVANRWVQPIKKGYRTACCDCGLVHEMDFRIVPYGSGRKVQFRVRRNDRATAAVRRHMPK